MSKHVSVLLHEAIDSLSVKEDGIYVDLTLGRGGHSREILKRLKSGHLYAFDKDDEAIEESKENLKGYEDHLTIIRDDFRNFRQNLDKFGVKRVDGILLDLGVSSPQFDEGNRGFSYRENSRLDMRMDTRQKLTAYDVVNTYSIQELTRIFREYGEDKYSYQIARKIIEKRQQKPVETTLELVEIIKESKPQKELAKKGHPAKQIFQALRIEVNDELGALKEALKDGLDCLSIGGRIVVITFHSLEDRITKVMFQEVSKVEGTRKNVYSLPSIDDEPDYKLVNNKVILPSETELEENPRSRSAKLRAIERIK